MNRKRVESKAERQVGRLCSARKPAERDLQGQSCCVGRAWRRAYNESEKAKCLKGVEKWIWG